MIIRGSRIAPSLWANGAGSTRELYVGERDGARWRLSMALVEGEGEFSVLPGVSRTLALVSGRVRLSFDGAAPVELTPEPIVFDGATPVTYVADEPSEDIGVMVWGDEPAPMAGVDLDGPLALDPTRHRAVVVLGGEAVVDREPLGFRDAVIVDARVRLVGSARIALIDR